MARHSVSLDEESYHRLRALASRWNLSMGRALQVLLSLVAVDETEDGDTVVLLQNPSPQGVWRRVVEVLPASEYKRLLVEVERLSKENERLRLENMLLRSENLRLKRQLARLSRGQPTGTSTSSGTASTTAAPSASSRTISSREPSSLT